MAVREGYKQTEIGVIPEDWIVTRLGCLGKFKNGINKDSDSFGYGSPFVNLLDVFGKSRITSGESLGLVATNIQEQQLYDLRKGDVLFIRSSVKPSGVGLTAVVENSLPSTVFSGFLIRFRDSELLHTDFKRYCFYEEGFRKRIIGASSVSANTNINQDNLKSIPIIIPATKAEQKVIAEALSDADGLIESLEQLIAKKRQIKQGAMQELLTGKRRLPGFEGEWKEKRFGDIFVVSGGVTASREQLSLEGHCYLHYGDIHASGTMFIDVKASYPDIPKLNISIAKVSKASLLDDGDIVFVDASEDDEGVSKHIVVINPDGIPFISGLHTIVAKSKTDYLIHEYRQYCFQTSKVKKQFRFYAAGAKVSGVSKKNIQKIKILFPNHDEQAAIATILSDMDTEISELEAKLAKARKIKQGMMQELLTGNIRLPLAQKSSASQKATKKPKHNKHFEDAAIIGTLAGKFGTEQYPISRKRYTKLSYLLHRYHEQDTSAYLKKAAGPYNPTTRYGGAEKIAQKNGYVCQVTGKYKGFVAGENVGQAQEYFLKWYGSDALRWLEQFRYAKSDELELWTTIDAAVQDVRAEGRAETLENVKAVLQGNKEWVKKLERPVFSDVNIMRAIQKVNGLFN